MSEAPLSTEHIIQSNGDGTQVSIPRHIWEENQAAIASQKSKSERLVRGVTTTFLVALLGSNIVLGLMVHKLNGDVQALEQSVAINMVGDCYMENLYRRLGGEDPLTILQCVDERIFWVQQSLRSASQ